MRGHTTTRITRGVWITSLLLLTYGHAGSQQPPCDLASPFSSPQVEASYMHLVHAGVSCSTNVTARETGQQVHVIHVTPEVTSSRDGGHRERPVVRLAVRPRRMAEMAVPDTVSFQPDNKAIIFILHSSVAVKWKVELQGMARDDKHLFIVSKDSSTNKFDRKTRTLAKFRKRGVSFSQDGASVTRWATRKWGGVTSYSRGAQQDYKFYVGRDVNAGPRCDPDSVTPSVHMYSIREEPKVIQGCELEQGRVLDLSPHAYVIELLSPPPESPGIKGVDLDIRELGDLPGDHMTQFNLVIKSPPGIKWTVHTPKMEGKVEIAADVPIDTRGLKMTNVNVKRDIIEVSGLDLIGWTKDYGNAPVKLFIRLDGVNSIKLRIPPARIPKSLPPRPDTTTLDPDEKMKMGHIKPSKSKADQKEKDLWRRMVRTTCDDKVMMVHVSKAFLKMTNLNRNNITLKDSKDPQCGVSNETATHYILQANQCCCGTRISYKTNKDADVNLFFYNQVVFHTSPDLISSLLTEELGSGYLQDDLEGSGGHDLYMATDDEDLDHLKYRENERKGIEVQCVTPVSDGPYDDIYPDPDPRPYPDLPSETDLRPKFDLEPEGGCHVIFYTSDKYNTIKSDYPVVEQGTRAYVSVDLFEADYTAQVDRCWVSPILRATDTGRGGRHTANSLNIDLINNNCPVDKYDVQWMQTEADARERINNRTARFSFVAEDFFYTGEFFLYCNLSGCDRAVHDHLCPVDGRERCNMGQHKDVAKKFRNTILDFYCGPIGLGPIRLTDKVKIAPQPKKAAAPSPDTPPAQPPKIIIEGLDVMTVVGIAFAAFIIGILLVAALWFIHTHTGPIKRGHHHRTPVPTSDLTPNSTSPWTA